MVNASDLLEINAEKNCYLKEITEIPSAPSLQSSLSKTGSLAKELKNRIQAFVAAHLFPFIEGIEIERIYADVEKRLSSEVLQNNSPMAGADELNKVKEKMLEEAKKAAREKKPPMVDALLKHLHKKNSKLPKKEDPKIQKFALQEYLKRAVIGLYKHLEVDSRLLIDPTESEPVEILENALKPALKYDFPNEQFSEKTLRKWVLIAFEEVNRKKCEKKLNKNRPSFDGFKDKKNQKAPLKVAPARSRPPTRGSIAKASS